MKYYPYRWVILKFTSSKSDEVTYKVLAGFEDSFNDYWKLNSGIVEVWEFINTELQVESIKFKGYSGSEYICDPEQEGFSYYTYSVFQDIQKKIYATDTHCVQAIFYEDFKEEFKNVYEQD